MSKRTKRKSGTSNTRKIIVVAIGAALVASILAIVYNPAQSNPDLESDLIRTQDEGKALLCGSGVANSNEYVQEYVIPTECSEPVGIVVDNEGVVWFAESAARKIGKFDPSTEKFDEFTLPDAKEGEKVAPIASIWDMKFDNEGNLWFTDVIANGIWKFDPRTEIFQVFKIPSTTDFGTSYPINFRFDEEGNIWFSEIYGKNIGFLDTANARHNTFEGIREFSASVDLETIGPMTFDNKGDIWFTALTYPISGKIMKFNIDENKFSTYDMPRGVSSPVGIVSDKEGNLWINDHGTSAFFKLNPETNDVTTYVTSLPRASTSVGGFEKCLTQPGGTAFTCGGLPVSLPYWNTFDDQGRLWMNLHQGNSIAVFDPREETLIEYFIPTQNPNWAACDDLDVSCGIANPLQFALGPDGKIWFTEWSENKIGVVDTSVPLRIELKLPNNRVDVAIGESVDVPIEIEAVGDLVSPVEIRLSGTIIPTGRLFNITAELSQQEVMFDAPSTKTVMLTLTPHDGLRLGEHRITVSAEYEEITYSRVLHLNVQPSKM